MNAFAAALEPQAWSRNFVEGYESDEYDDAEALLPVATLDIVGEIQEGGELFVGCHGAGGYAVQATLGDAATVVATLSVTVPALPVLEGEGPSVFDAGDDGFHDYDAEREDGEAGTSSSATVNGETKVVGSVLKGTGHRDGLYALVLTEQPADEAAAQIASALLSSFKPQRIVGLTTTLDSRLKSERPVCYEVEGASFLRRVQTPGCEGSVECETLGAPNVVTGVAAALLVKAAAAGPDTQCVVYVALESSTGLDVDTLVAYERVFAHHGFDCLSGDQRAQNYSAILKSLPPSSHSTLFS